MMAVDPTKVPKLTPAQPNLTHSFLIQYVVPMLVWDSWDNLLGGSAIRSNNKELSLDEESAIDNRLDVDEDSDLDEAPLYLDEELYVDEDVGFKTSKIKKPGCEDMEMSSLESMSGLIIQAFSIYWRTGSRQTSPIYVCS